MTKDKFQINTNSEYSEQNSKIKTGTASNRFGSLKIKIWDLFVFWCLSFDACFLMLVFWNFQCFFVPGI
ncbi:MAG: hypothetical protein EPN37_17775 [Chitinophagaceae bacterium]|nr:MAG: hypothetical protein EPN37_17775 [Chitinophagaceae bacterium]